MPRQVSEAAIYCGPVFIVLAVFVFYPLLANVYFSLFSFSAMSVEHQFKGIENYQRLFSDPVILTSLINNGLYAAISVLSQVGMGLVLAAVLEQTFLRRIAPVIRSLLFLPAILSVTVVTFIFAFFYDPFSGLINLLLESVGLAGLQRAWLGQSETAIYAVIAVSQWNGVGYIMMLLIVAMQNIPRDLYEAAELDGAGPIAQFFYITIPEIREMLIVSTVVTVTGALTVFSEPFILTGGGPGYSSTVLATYMYQSAFFRDEMGYASTIASLLFFFTMLVSLVQIRLFRNKSA